MKSNSVVKEPRTPIDMKEWNFFSVSDFELDICLSFELARDTSMIKRDVAGWRLRWRTTLSTMSAIQTDELLAHPSYSYSAKYLLACEWAYLFSTFPEPFQEIPPIDRSLTKIASELRSANLREGPEQVRRPLQAAHDAIHPTDSSRISVAVVRLDSRMSKQNHLDAFKALIKDHPFGGRKNCGGGRAGPVRKARQRLEDLGKVRLVEKVGWHNAAAIYSDHTRKKFPSEHKRYYDVQKRVNKMRDDFRNRAKLLKRSFAARIKREHAY